MSTDAKADLIIALCALGVAGCVAFLVWAATHLVDWR